MLRGTGSFTLVLCLALAGCNHPDAERDATTPDASSPTLAREASDTTLSPRQAGAAQDATVVRHASLLSTASGTASSAAPATTDDSPSSRALADAATMHINAAAGGLYRSPDGSLEVKIPPGALTQDADVKFASVDPRSVSTASGATPGIVVVADWGGAKLNPNSQIPLKARVDPSFLPAVQAADPKTGPATLGMTRDAKGDWYLPIVVQPDAHGAVAAVDSTPVGTRHLQEVTQVPYTSVKVDGKTDGSNGQVVTPLDGQVINGPLDANSPHKLLVVDNRHLAPPMAVCSFI